MPLIFLSFSDSILNWRIVKFGGKSKTVRLIPAADVRFRSSRYVLSYSGGSSDLQSGQRIRLPSL